jgi:hypothetical protein
VTLLRYAGTLLLGALVSVACVVVHRTAVPFGLLLAVVTTFALVWFLDRRAAARAVASYGLGWLAVLVLVVAGRPEGDYAVAQDLPGYLLLATGLAVLLVTLVVLPLRHRPLS